MKKTSILIITVFIMAILTACGSSAGNSQKQETIVKQPEATSMTVESDVKHQSLRWLMVYFNASE